MNQNRIQLEKMEGTLPTITSHIEIIKLLKKYSIGKIQGSFVLMYDINFSKAKSSLSNYISFIRSLLSNNSKSFYLSFQGVYLSKTYMKHFLVFEYPHYQLITASKSSEFNKNLIINNFIQFLNQLTSDELIYLMLSKDLIFFNEKKELQLVYFGNIDKIKLPSFKKNWEKKMKKKEEGKDDTKLTHLIKFVFSLYYSMNDKIDIDKIIFKQTPDELQLWKFKVELPEEIASLIDAIFRLINKQSHKVSNLDLIKLKLKFTENSSENNGNIEPKADVKFNIEQRQIDSFIIGNQNDHRESICSNVNANRNSLKKGLLFMFKYFPIEKNLPRLVEYHTEATDRFKKDCLSPSQIPKIKKKAPQNTIKPKQDSQNKSIKPKAIKDNWLNFKYSSHHLGIFEYNQSYSANKLQPLLIIKYLNDSESIWPVNMKFPFQQDISLNFLSICNYDIYKALYNISYLHPIFIKFIKEAY